MVGKRNKPEINTVTVQKITAMLYALDNEDGMSDWEHDFVADISDKFTNGKSLSDKQYNKLKSIYDKFN